MRTLLLFALLALFVSPVLRPASAQEGSSVTVLVFKWYKSREVIEKLDSSVVLPMEAMIPQNKNFERNRRNNSPEGVRDPNLDTIDGRSSALEKSVQESRMPSTKPVDGFAYRVKVKNTTARVIEILFWEYQFIDPSDPANVARRQFLCGVNIKPNKEKELQAFSASGPNGVVNIESLATTKANPFQERVVINRVEYSDGTIWQRKDWKFAEIRLTYARAVGTPWGSEMCRGL